MHVPPTQTSVEHGYWEQKGLTSALTDQGPYEFAVIGAGDEYIDFANTYLFVEAQIVADDDIALVPERTLNLSTYGCIICTDLLWAVNAFRAVNPLLSVVLLY
jgi:hypothetical protein